jgi:uncharacterized protein YceK
MRNVFIVLTVVFLAGCAAPPPVKIASKLIGKNLLKQSKADTQAQEDTQTTAP